MTSESPPSASVDRIGAYLEEHKQTSSRDALQRKLIEDGHDPQAVDLAIAQAYGFQIHPPSAAPHENRTTVVMTLGTLFLLSYVVWSLATALMLREESFAGLLLIPTMLILEIAAAVGLSRHKRSLAHGLAWGIAPSILPIVTLALFFGICVAIVYGLY